MMKQVMSTMLVVTGLALVAMTEFGMLIVQHLLRELGGELAYAIAIARRITAGDQCSAVHTKDRDESSLFAAIGAIQSNLAEIDDRVRTDATASASRQIAAGNPDLSSVLSNKPLPTADGRVDGRVDYNSVEQFGYCITRELTRVFHF